MSEETEKLRIEKERKVAEAQRLKEENEKKERETKAMENHVRT